MSFTIFVILLLTVYCGGILTIFTEPNPFGWEVDEGKHKTPLWVHYYFIFCLLLFVIFMLTSVISIVGMFL
jgi:hypothetical protein|tara:strand:- start:143 stop:355 length:213 start_codon:yes stop_codon:yes gene_type:complete